MAFGLLPLAIGAIGAIGSLIRRRRASQALAGASFSTTSQSTPTPGISDAASGPNSAQTPAGQANSELVGQGFQSNSGDEASRAASPLNRGNQELVGQGLQSNSGDEASRAASPLVRPPVQPATGPQQTPGDTGLAARLGEESIARSRKVNKRQNTLSQNSLGGGV